MVFLHPLILLIWLAIIPIIIWTIIWKGIALWKAAKRDDTAWFIIMLVVNTLGILEIIYIFAVANKPKKKVRR